MVRGLMWDDWNKQHLHKHGVSIEDVEEVCHGRHKVIESYRKRIQIVGKTKNCKILTIILSPEDRNLKAYKKGIYYPITAFKEEDL